MFGIYNVINQSSKKKVIFSITVLYQFLNGTKHLLLIHIKHITTNPCPSHRQQVTLRFLIFI